MHIASIHVRSAHVECLTLIFISLPPPPKYSILSVDPLHQKCLSLRNHLQIRIFTVTFVIVHTVRQVFTRNAPTSRTTCTRLTASNTLTSTIATACFAFAACNYVIESCLNTFSRTSHTTCRCPFSSLLSIRVLRELHLQVSKKKGISTCCR